MHKLNRFAENGIRYMRNNSTVFELTDW